MLPRRGVTDRHDENKDHLSIQNRRVGGYSSTRIRYGLHGDINVLLKARLQQNFESSPNLRGRIFAIIHCTSLHCWKFLHRFNCIQLPTTSNFQQCWILTCFFNNVGSCCVRLHGALYLHVVVKTYNLVI